MHCPGTPRRTVASGRQKRVLTARVTLRVDFAHKVMGGANPLGGRRSPRAKCSRRGLSEIVQGISGMGRLGGACSRSNTGVRGSRSSCLHRHSSPNQSSGTSSFRDRSRSWLHPALCRWGSLRNLSPRSLNDSQHHTLSHPWT